MGARRGRERMGSGMGLGHDPAQVMSTGAQASPGFGISRALQLFGPFMSHICTGSGKRKLPVNARVQCPG